LPFIIPFLLELSCLFNFKLNFQNTFLLPMPYPNLDMFLCLVKPILFYLKDKVSKSVSGLITVIKKMDL
jgi:hypothetical protein